MKIIHCYSILYIRVLNGYVNHGEGARRLGGVHLRARGVLHEPPRREARAATEEANQTMNRMMNN